jgi:hypothetical protein
MSENSADVFPFEGLRPQLLALLALYRTAKSEEACEALEALFERAFLAAAWHVAQDLLDNGWSPTVVSSRVRRSSTELRVVGGADAA